jgi:hypothetical protein
MTTQNGISIINSFYDHRMEEYWDLVGVATLVPADKHNKPSAIIDWCFFFLAAMTYLHLRRPQRQRDYDLPASLHGDPNMLQFAPCSGIPKCQQECLDRS